VKDIPTGKGAEKSNKNMIEGMCMEIVQWKTCNYRFNYT